MSQLILGIESSCDEVAAALYQQNVGLLSHTIFSQSDFHKQYGGVVPEIASRSHIEKINMVVQSALDQGHKNLDDITTIAVTNKPGLPGSLLIGLCFAKALAWAKHKRLIGINHLEGHAFSSFLEHQIPFPHVCLTASGGHTSLYLIEDFGDYIVLGQTLDDAAGEAFDKIAKLMQFPYPGGPHIEKLARDANFEDFFHYPRGNVKTLDFSFSGLKTAVLYDLVKRGAYDLAKKQITPHLTDTLKKQVASSLLVCIKDIFIHKYKQALELYPHSKAITFVGGVACNRYLQTELALFAKQHKLQFFHPSPQFCTDNAAMIAFVGNYKAMQNRFSDYSLDIFE